MITAAVATASLLLGFGLAHLRGPKGPALRAGREQNQLTLPARLADELPLAVLVYAETGEIVYANAEARALLFDDAAVLGHNFLDLLERAPPPLRQILLDGQDGSTRLELEGRRETVQVLRRRLSLGGHEHVAVVLNLVTQMLGQQESQVLAKVIRVISHELNNSLASMASLLHSGRIITERASTDDQLSRVFHGLEGRVTHLREFLGDYAALARLPRPRRTEIDWPAFLSRISAGFPDCRFPEPPTATGFFDSAQVEQLLSNLLENAIESGSPVDEVELRIDVADDGIELRVLDRGAGFSDEALENGLMPFYTTKEGGSGVGLALCRDIAHGHGGNLSIRSREGGGSQVGCWLPTAAQSQPSRRVHLSLTRT